MDSIYSAFTNAERGTLENKQLQNELDMQPLRQQQAQAQLGALQALTAGRQLDQKIQQEEYDRATQGRTAIAEGLKGLTPVDKTKSFAEQQQALTDQLATLQNLAGVAAQSNLPGEATRIQNQAQALQKQLTAAALQRNESLLSAATVAKAGGAKSWQQFVDSIPTLFPEHSQAVLVAGPALRDPNSEVSKAVLGNLQADVLGRKEQMKLAGEADDREEAKRSTRVKEQFEARRVNVAERQISLAEQKAREERAAEAGTAGQGRQLPKGQIDPFAGAKKNPDGSVTTTRTDGTQVVIPASEQYTQDNKGRMYYPDGTVEIGEMQQAKSRNMRAEDSFRQAAGALARSLDLSNKTTSGAFQGRNSVGLLWAPAGNAANFLSSTQTQQYNAIVAGFVKDMAVAQAQGAHVPEGEIKELRDSMTIRDGDPPATKLTKLANIRSNLDTTARTIYNNRGIPFPRRDAVWKAAQEINELIPFTVEDVQKAKDLKAKGKTYKDWAASVGKGAGASPKKDPNAEANAYLKSLGL